MSSVLSREGVRAQSARHTLVITSLFLLLVAALLLTLSLGSVSIPFQDVVNVLTGGSATRDSWTNIILKFRLPKALTAMLAGAALSTGGLLMQTLFRNPLADPFVLGISSGASLGVALVILTASTQGLVLLAGLGLQGDLALTVAASLGGGAVMLLVLLVANRVRSSVTLLILGLMVGYMVSAFVSLLIYFSIPERIQAYTNWTFGSFGGVTWSQLIIFVPVVVIGLLISGALAKPLNALLLGEAYASSLGVNMSRIRLGIIIAVGLLAGAVTAFCGPIGFLGIAAPHLGRAAVGTSDHRIMIPVAILVGALMALFADFVTQLPGSQTVLPLNAVTALIGAPVVILVILRGRTLKSSFG